MGKTRISFALSVFLCLAAILAACNLSGVPEATPTVDVTDSLATIEAIASLATNAVSGSTPLPPTVLTAIAQIPSRTPTAFPTITPLPSATSTHTLIPTAVLPPVTRVPPPTASFNTSTTSGLAPLTVQFTNLSSGLITSFNWNFGDGTTSSEFNPSHRFNAPGVYNVVLVVSGPGGSTNFTQQIVVQAPAPPVAAFVPSVTGGAVPLTVQFTNQSSGVISGLVWNFGDGTTSTEQSPSHTFTAPGLYNVRLTVTGPGGTSSATSAITAQSQSPSIPPPVAAFTLSVSSDPAGLTVRFTNLSTGNITSYLWNFGDGNISTDINPVHIYTRPGQYAVTLTVSGPGGQRSAITQITFAPTPVIPPTATQIPTATPTLTPTFTETPTETPIPTDAPTLEPTFTETPTETPTLEPTFTETPTEMPTLEPTFTETPIPTDAPTLEPTLTETPTETPTLEPTFTETPTETPTLEPTLTETPTETPTLEPTFTETPTETPTLEPTLTETPTETPTLEPTLTETPTETPTEPPTEVPTGPVDITPIIPNISGGVLSNLTAIFNDGAARGNRPSVFAFAGDETAANLSAFAVPGGYILDNTTAHLQAIIDWYSQTPIDGGLSLNRQGAASGSGWTAQGLVLPFPVDTGACLAGETPLACEFRLIQPAAVLISIGANDVIAGTDLNTFRSYIDQAIQIARDNGVMPILMTIPPRLDGAVSPDQTRAYNEAIIAAAEAAQVPVINIWRAVNSLPDNGLSAGVNLSVSPNGAGDLTEAAITTYGLNARSWALLTTLNDLRNAVFPNAAP